MTRLMLILSALAAVLLIASPAALACENCGCQKAKAAKAEKAAKAKDCPADCDCPACKAKKAKAEKAKSDKAKTDKAKAHAGCDCAHKGSHPECPHAKANKKSK